MFERLAAFLKNLSGEHAGTRPDEALVASVALALTVIRADGAIVAREKAMLESRMREHFGLDHHEFMTLLAAAKADDTGSSDDYRHAIYLRRHLGEAQRSELVSILWTLVDADGVHNEVEDHLVARIAEMLGVPANASVGPGGANLKETGDA